MWTICQRAAPLGSVVRAASGRRRLQPGPGEPPGLAVGPPPPRHVRGLLLHGCPALVLGEDDVDRLLEHRPRRPRFGGDPLRDVVRMRLENGRELLAAAGDHLALLQDARAHLRPSRLLFHRLVRSNRYARVRARPCLTHVNARASRDQQ